MTTSENPLADKRDRVEELRQRVADAKAEAAARVTSGNDAVEARNLDDEESRLLRELAEVQATNDANEADAKSASDDREAAHDEANIVSVEGDGGSFQALSAPGEGPGYKGLEARLAERREKSSLDFDELDSSTTPSTPADSETPVDLAGGTSADPAPVITDLQSGDVTGTDLQTGSNDFGLDADDNEGR